eukprot:403375253
MATAAVLLLLSQTNAIKPTDFPESDLYHVGCKLITQFDLISCTEVYDRMFTMIKAFGNEDPQKGHYQVRENVDQSYIWVNRTSEKHDMVDDTLFEFKQTQQGCKVRGRSVAQSVSFYDFETNYCNIWNVMYFAEGPRFKIVEDEDCQWKPKDPTTHCVRPSNQTQSEEVAAKNEDNTQLQTADTNSETNQIQEDQSKEEAQSEQQNDVTAPVSESIADTTDSQATSEDTTANSTQ